MAEALDYSPPVIAEFERLATECCVCYQCGTCTSSCPSGNDLDRGPHRLVRFILAGDIDAVMRSEELWRCAGCGACTEACRMAIDVAAVLRRLRALEREHGTAIRCPERTAAEIAAATLHRRPYLDMMRFGLTMATRGHVPRDKASAAGTGVRLARQMLPIGKKAANERPLSAVDPVPNPHARAETLPFYAGCGLLQNRPLLAAVHDVAAGFGINLAETPEAGCCGHPSRGAVPSRCATEVPVQTVCPACDTSLAREGVATVSLWASLTARARRQGLRMRAAAPSFVPYVGCLADRDAGLAALDEAAELSNAAAVRSYPTLHSGCCGALGGTYRGATRASVELLDFAARQRAPVVSPCTLCADNLRSAAREIRRDVTVYFWPEFFRAAEPVLEDSTDA